MQVWDVTANKKVNTLEGHSARVGALAWNGDLLSSGSRDRLILQVGGTFITLKSELFCFSVDGIKRIISILERRENPECCS